MWRTSCVTHMSSMSCPSLLQTAVGYSAVLGFIPRGTSHFFTGGPARPLPLLTEWSAPIPAWRSLVSWASHVRRELLRAMGLHPLSKLSARSARLWTVQQHTVWPEERGVAAPLGDLEFGTYFPAGGSSPESSRRRSRPAVLLAVHCVSEKPTASYGVRPAETGAPGCRAGMRSLRSDRPSSTDGPTARSEFTPTVRTPYDHQLRLALTEPARGSVRQV